MGKKAGKSLIGRQLGEKVIFSGKETAGLALEHEKITPPCQVNQRSRDRRSPDYCKSR